MQNNKKVIIKTAIWTTITIAIVLFGLSMIIDLTSQEVAYTENVDLSQMAQVSNSIPPIVIAPPSTNNPIVSIGKGAGWLWGKTAGALVKGLKEGIADANKKEKSLIKTNATTSSSTPTIRK